MEEVTGSIPVRSTNNPLHINCLAGAPYALFTRIGAE